MSSLRLASCQPTEPCHCDHASADAYMASDPAFDLLHQVESTLAFAGYHIINEAHAMPADGARYFGLIEVAGTNQPSDHSLVLGLRNSHDKRFPAGLAVGHAVFCCDNLAFSAEVVISRKHTRFILRDLPMLVDRAIGQLGTLEQQQDQRIDRYKQTRLNDLQAHDLMVRAVDARVLPPSQLQTVINEWREPGHNEFTENGRSVWRLFNGFTEAIKGRNIEALPKRTQALHGLMDMACGLTTREVA